MSNRLRIDAHVHLVALDEKNHKCFYSPAKRKGLTFRFLSRMLDMDMNAQEERIDIAYADRLAKQVREAQYLDKAVIFAMDGLYDSKGARDPRTEMVVSNDWAIEVCRRHPDVFLFGASIHPARADAIDELDKCAEAGAVCVKWIPPSQNINPSDPKFSAFYERMLKHKLVLTSHTGYEHSIFVVDQSLGDPLKLKLPLEMGLTVVAGHAGTSGVQHRVEYFPNFVRMAADYDNLYGDTAAITALFRGSYRKKLLTNPIIKNRIIQGTDYPVPPQPFVWPIAIGPIKSIKMQFIKNPFDQDYIAKKAAGFDDEHFFRGHDVFLGTRNS